MDITATDYTDGDMPGKMFKQQQNSELINFDTRSSKKYMDL